MVCFDLKSHMKIGETGIISKNLRLLQNTVIILPMNSFGKCLNSGTSH